MEMRVQHGLNSQLLFLSLSAKLHPQSPYPFRHLLQLIPPTTLHTMPRGVSRLFHRPITTSGREGQSIRIEIISGNNLRVPSERIPAGICICINVKSRRRWKSATRSLSSEESVAWGDTVTLSSHASPTLSVEIRASYEVDRTLGGGEVIGKLQTSWDKVLDHGDERFELSFPPVRGVCPSLTLKATVVHPCDDQDGGLFDSIVNCEVARDTDAGHAQFAKYTRRKTVSHLNGAVKHFRLVLDQWSGYIQNDLQDIDTTTSLFREAFALRPQGHPDHAFSLYNLIRALNRRYSKEPTAVYIHNPHSCAASCCPSAPEGTYFRSIGVDGAANYVISGCNNLPIDASDDGIHLRRVVLELCPLGHQRPIDDIDESIRLRREAVSLCPEGHADRNDYLSNLACSLQSRFDHQGQYRDLNEVISTHEEVLRLRPDRALLTRFNHRGVIDDINRAISLHREQLTLRPSGHPRRDTTLNTLPSRSKPDMRNCMSTKILTRPLIYIANPFG
ncbi:hypothetical protein EDB19DRAFT_2043950 [Suillus lakei]|nr:hypothetical protein EDB19DRAFT_2043950 [Suillus lakei]